MAKGAVSWPEERFRTDLIVFPVESPLLRHVI